MKVHEYVSPEKFEVWAKRAEELGFLYVASGPLVRSSFKANQLMKSALGKRLLEGVGRGGEQAMSGGLMAEEPVVEQRAQL